MKLQNEEVIAQKHIKFWLMSWTDQSVHKWEISQKKAVCITVY